MTLTLAIWGAAIGTLTFLWNVWRWHHDKPRIIARVEAMESHRYAESFSALRLTVRNRGGKRTTIEEIFFYQPVGWFEMGLKSVYFRLCGLIMWRHNLGALEKADMKFPMPLEINATWNGYIQLELSDPDNEEEIKMVEMSRNLSKRVDNGTVRYAIQCSHTNRKIYGVIESQKDDLML